ncbi:MAG: serine protease [Proteobacteria bacterium]|nr:serine protease [Pseudomonadota bacterium]
MRPELTVESLEAVKATKADVRALADAYEKLSERLLPEATVAVAKAAVAHPEAPGNIVGFGIGEKIRKGQLTGRPALKVLVREKVDPGKLSEATMVPETIDGVETDVDETGEIVAYQFRDKHRPAPGGASISNCKENAAGTLGCWVDAEKYVCILSNNHVMARSNAASKGEPICQPGRLDGGVCPEDVIAKLLRFVKINFSGGSNEVDAAIAAATNSRYVEPRILRAQNKLEKLSSPIVAPALGMDVQKSGRTTGHTKGRVNLVAATINVNYGSQGIARFDNQFRVSAPSGNFSQPGDSGSLVTTLPSNQPVGLLFAGGGGFTFCNEIKRVLRALTVEIHY